VTSALRALGLAAIAPISILAAFACRHEADERPVASLSSSPEMEGRFDDLRARWIDGSPAVRAAMRNELNALDIELDKRGDGLEPIVRAYLAISWLYAGVPAAAEATSRPLIDGPPGVANDLGMLVKGASARRLGRPREAIDLLRPLIGKLIDPFARPLLYEEITEAFLDESRYEDAVVYAEGWLRSSTTPEKKETRGAIARVLHRIPDTVALKMLEADAVAAPEERHSPDMLMILSARVDEGSSAIATSDAGAAAGDGGIVAAGDAAAAPTPTVATVIPVSMPVRFDPRTIGVLVPTTAPGLGASASAIVRAAAAVATPTLATALHADAGSDASQPNLLGHRLAVLDTGGTANGMARALDAAEREGAGVIIGGLTESEANALAGLAQSRRIATILLRRPTVLPPMLPGEKQAWIALGMSASDEARATLDAAKKGEGTAVIDPWPDAGQSVPPSDDPLRARCDATPKTAGGTAFPIAAWRARKVTTIVVLGDARCARKLSDEIVAAANPPWHPTLVLSPSALELAHVSLPLQRIVVGSGILPASDDAPPALRTLWIDQGAPVSIFGALGHDAATLAAAALPGDLVASTETAALQKARAITTTRLFGAKGQLWTTTASGPSASGVVAQTTHTKTVSAGGSMRPSWAPTP